MERGLGILKPASYKTISEIIRGTGRFEGIKGTGTATFMYFPVEEEEPGARGIGEGTLSFTLPSKDFLIMGWNQEQNAQHSAFPIKL